MNNFDSLIHMHFCRIIEYYKYTYIFMLPYVNTLAVSDVKILKIHTTIPESLFPTENSIYFTCWTYSCRKSTPVK